MATRQEHAEDIKARLVAAAIPDVVLIEVGRVLPVERMPAILIYGTDERAERHGTGPVYEMTYVLKIEVRVQEASGFDTKCGQIVRAVKSALLSDPDWLVRWMEAPNFDVRQFLDDKGSAPFCGEIISFTCEDVDLAEFPAADSLGRVEAVRVEVHTQSNGAAPDDDPEAVADIVP